jgi:arabinofuranosyltransferase
MVDHKPRLGATRMRGGHHWPLLGILLGAAILTFLGWRLFWFLTDDAYICFRYVSNSILGHGYVWNPPPFQAVEGYSCFLWVVLLDLIWRILGVSPPEAANVTALIFSLLTLGIAAATVLRLNWTPRLQRHRLLFLGLVLWGTTTNRTFLTWTSSGLETAMYNFLVMAWVYLGTVTRMRGSRRQLALAATAAAIYLTRPDGMLFAAATLPILWFLSPHKRGLIRIPALAAWFPLAAIPAHLLWRRNLYGEWLPNTYYAKFTGAWPESGWRYAASFVLEHALWIWLLLAAVVLIPRLPSLLRSLHPGCADAPPVANGQRPAGIAAARLVVGATLATHFIYYTFVIGGDHFEYRVYSHLVLLLFISFIWLLNCGNWKPGAAAGLLTAAILLSYPVPWTHWALTQHLETREETSKLRVPVAPHWPAPFQWYARTFDDLQDWLIDHMVAMRHPEHRALHRAQLEFYPSREEGARISGQDYPVFVGLAVGFPAWVMPHVNIIDTWGLNDYVIARNARGTTAKRLMAHERQPPQGYLECFQPNVRLIAPKKLQVFQRQPPLTADRIAACERDWRRRVRQRSAP